MKTIRGLSKIVLGAMLGIASASAEEIRLKDYVDSVIQIESSGNPLAFRYEPALGEGSYGLGQLLGSTAKELERKHPELPKLGNDRNSISNNLCDPKINREYTAALFSDNLSFYGDAFLAVAAYNSGPLTPRNARVQEQLNQLYNSGLTCDGIIGKKSKEAIRYFQKEQGLREDGILGNQTYSRLQSVWTSKFPTNYNPKGIIPTNNITPHHVKKFKTELEKRAKSNK